MEDTEKLLKILKKNDILMQVFNNVRRFEFESYYVGAGCITQTIWNDLTNRPINYGITDIDLIYFNDKDISYEAEDEIIRKGNLYFSEIPIKVDIKNQARVHMWYKDKFGVEIKPYQTIEQAIDTWPSTATAIGVRYDNKDDLKVYAPFGLKDLFTLTVRPNKTLITEEIYTNKANKWKTKWPELNVIMWNKD